VTSWTFLTAHARVMLLVARDPGVRLRDIAASLGITERSAFGIITDLVEAGYVVKEKDGRRNRYHIQAHLPLPEPTARERTVGEVLALLTGTDATTTEEPTAAADSTNPRLRPGRTAAEQVVPGSSAPGHRGHRLDYDDGIRRAWCHGPVRELSQSRPGGHRSFGCRTDRLRNHGRGRLRQGRPGPAVAEAQGARSSRGSVRLSLRRWSSITEATCRTHTSNASGSCACMRRSLPMNVTMFCTVRSGSPCTPMNFPPPASAKPGIVPAWIP
jgi:hypothetical protein